jgi:hypothetical protein
MTKALLLLTVAAMSLQGIHAMELPEKKDEPNKINGYDAKLVLEQEKLFEQFRLEKEKREKEQKEKEVKVPSIAPSKVGSGDSQAVPRPSLFPNNPFPTNIYQNAGYPQNYIQQPPFPSQPFGSSPAYGQIYPQGYGQQPPFQVYPYGQGIPYIPPYGQSLSQSSVEPVSTLQPVYQPSSVSSVANTNRPREEKQEPQLSDEEYARKLYLELNGMPMQEEAKSPSKVPSLVINNSANMSVSQDELEMMQRLQLKLDAEERAKEKQRIESEEFSLKQQEALERAAAKHEEEKNVTEALRLQQKWEAKIEAARQRLEEQSAAEARRLQEKYEAKHAALQQARVQEDEESYLEALKLQFGEEPGAIGGHGEDEDYAAALRIQEELNSGGGAGAGADLADDGPAEVTEWVLNLAAKVLVNPKPLLEDYNRLRPMDQVNVNNLEDEKTKAVLFNIMIDQMEEKHQTKITVKQAKWIYNKVFLLDDGD